MVIDTKASEILIFFNFFFFTDWMFWLKLVVIIVIAKYLLLSQLHGAGFQI